MEIHELNAFVIRKCFLAAANELASKKEWINELNVFPVPDGDTGTNMTMTMMSAAKEVAALETDDMKVLCKAIASGSLRGARGNSGVILSQLFRGFTRELAAAEKSTVEIPQLAAAFVRATETAYKAVMKPKEGTILTVARAMSDKAEELQNGATDIIAFAKDIIAAGDAALEQTPELLPVLKQAGVVDSGGQGLMTVMHGAFQALSGEIGEVFLENFDAAQASESREAHPIDTSHLDTSEIRFGYCTEFIVNLEHPLSDDEEQAFKSFLESIGDSIVCVASEDMVKVHVHTNDPGLAIQKGLSMGSLSRMKIDNMREEHNERLIRNASQLAAEEKRKQAASAEKKPYGFLSVSVGDGLDRIFKEIGVDQLISGGQTMNPSTEDILNAITAINADTIFILPNNKNIILAAQQARDLTKGKNVVVVPTRNIPEGITAMVSFLPESSPEENLAAMQEAIRHLATAEVTYAVRDTTMDDFEIHAGDFMAIGQNGMLTVEKKVEDAVLNAIEKLTADGKELVTLYYGSDVSEQNAKLVKELAEARFEDCEVELNYGGQPVYYYFISAE
ncbi:DAK2 domain fusion protein YloV [Stomatobaculum longum]|uniref:DAK2 domain fusion protein YloV n=1 Tax=Stomatobaculum longum TaxID=796942 RepID=A0AA37DH56_9FIRM|nr:DAK2 domain-containing protein [Stomatobaculum longum]EHO18094.1 DAK2 domain fusion protein YloV [Stomatobaculum longum]